jgi:hypothetical protein
MMLDASAPVPLFGSTSGADDVTDPAITGRCMIFDPARPTQDSRLNGAFEFCTTRRDGSRERRGGPCVDRAHLEAPRWTRRALARASSSRRSCKPVFGVTGGRRAQSSLGPIPRTAWRSPGSSTICAVGAPSSPCLGGALGIGQRGDNPADRWHFRHATEQLLSTSTVGRYKPAELTTVHRACADMARAITRRTYVTPTATTSRRSCTRDTGARLRPLRSIRPDPRAQRLPSGRRLARSRFGGLGSERLPRGGLAAKRSPRPRARAPRSRSRAGGTSGSCP